MLQPLVEEPDAKHAKNAPSSLDPMMQSMSLAPFQEIKKMTNDHSNQQQDLHLLQQTGDGMPKDKQSLCIDILVNGHVNSFVDFFYLTHRSDEESNNNRSNFPDEQLQFIKNNVTIAEKAHRRGE